MRFLQGRFDLLLSRLKTEDLLVTKNEIRSFEFYSQKTSSPYVCFNSIDEYYRPIDQLDEEHFNNVLYSSDSEGIESIFELFRK